MERNFVGAPHVKVELAHACGQRDHALTDPAIAAQEPWQWGLLVVTLLFFAYVEAPCGLWFVLLTILARARGNNLVLVCPS